MKFAFELNCIFALIIQKCPLSPLIQLSDIYSTFLNNEFIILCEIANRKMWQAYMAAVPIRTSKSMVQVHSSRIHIHSYMRNKTYVKLIVIYTVSKRQRTTEYYVTYIPTIIAVHFALRQYMQMWCVQRTYMITLSRK